MMDIDFVRSRFVKHFDGKTGNVYASPGRINLIGEHTDYNGGYVFPGAVDKGVMAEIRPNGTEDTVMAYAIDLKDRVDFKLSDPNGPRASWARYIYGIALEMRKRGANVKGFNIAFAGDVPLGAGMSSSAAMESCFAFGLNDLFADGKVSQWDMVLAGQATEHNYCGVNCGIMDQFASVFGKSGCLMRLDWPPNIRRPSSRLYVTAHGSNLKKSRLTSAKKTIVVLSLCSARKTVYSVSAMLLTKVTTSVLVN